MKDLKEGCKGGVSYQGVFLHPITIRETQNCQERVGKSLMVMSLPLYEYS